MMIDVRKPMLPRAMIAYLAEARHADAGTRAFLHDELAPALRRIGVLTVDCRMARAMVDALKGDLLPNDREPETRALRADAEERLSTHAQALALGADVVVAVLNGTSAGDKSLREVLTAIDGDKLVIGYLSKEEDAQPDYNGFVAAAIRDADGRTVGSLHELEAALADARIGFALRQPRREEFA